MFRIDVGHCRTLKKGGFRMLKNKKISVRMSEEQFDWLQNQANKKNINISDFICGELIDKKRLGFLSWLKLWLKRF
jgi:hypothetical protein